MSHPTLTLPDDMTIESLRPALWLTAGRGVGTTGARSLAQARGEQFQGAIVAGHALKDLAMSAWVCPVSSPSIQSPFIFYTGGNGPTYPGMCLRQSQTSRYPMMYFATGVDGTNEYIQKATSMPLNAWTHIFGYVDRANKVLYLYVNGVLANSASFSGNGSSFDLSSYMAIGGMSGLPSEYRYDGRISRCGYFIGTLDHAAAAQHLYNQGNGRFWAEVTQADLIAAGKHYYNLNETQLSSAIDAIGTNDLAISGYNLLANPGFETLGAGGADVFGTWVEASAGASTISADTGRTGSYSCLLTVDGSGSLAQVTQPSAVITGRKYAYSCYAKSSPSGRDLVITDGLGTWGIHTLTASWAQYSGTAVAGFTSFVFKRSGTLTESLWIDDMSLTSAQIDSAVGPREAMAADLVGGYHGLLTNMDAVSSWSTDTPDGSYTASKLDSVGTAHGTMTGFTDIDAAHVDGPDGAWGPAITDRGSSPAQGWLLSSVKDSRSASVPNSLNTRIFDEYYTEPASTGSRWLTRGTSYQKFAMTNPPAFGTGDFSVEFMMYPATSGAGEFPIGCGGYTTATPGISVYRTGAASYIQLNICDSVGAVVNVTSPMAATPYAWYHVVATVNRATNTANLWLNGTLVASGSIASLSGSFTPGATLKSIGARDTADTSYTYDGALSNVRFYLGNVLTAAEIAESYAGGKGRTFAELSTALAAKVTHNYDMDGESGDGEPDTVGGNNATVGGTGTISSAASPYLPAYDATLVGFTSSPRSSDVPTALVGKCKSILGATGTYTYTATKTITGMGARSVGIWFKRNGNPAAIERIAAECSTTGTGFGFYLDTSGRLYSHITASGVQVAAKSTSVSFCDNQWHYAVATWDGTTNANAYSLITDLESGTATATATSQGGASQYNFQLCGYAGGPNSVFQGYVCRPTIWAGRALTAGEITTWASGGDVTEGLTAEWRFNEPDAITVPFEHAIKCDGANTIVDCGSNPIGTNAVTISGWAAPITSGEGSGCRIVDNGACLLTLHPAGSSLSRNNGGSIVAVSGLSFAAGTWVHIAATCDSNGNAAIFINGSRSTITSIKEGNAGTPTSGSTLYIANRAAQDRTFDGLIGQVRIDSGVLTQAQIRQLAMGQSPATPTHDWRFDDPLDLPYLSGCKAVRFDGVDDLLTCGDNLDAGLSDFTIMAWGRTTDTTAVNFPTLLGKYDTATTAGRYRIRLNTNTVTFNYQATAGNYSTPASGAVNDGQWHHFAATADRDGNASLYVDGVLIGTVSIAAASAENHNTTAAFMIGDAGTTDGNWGGDIADARHYPAALTQAQIRSLIAGTDFRTGISAQWKFGETPRSIPSCAGGYSLKFDGVDDSVDCGATIPAMTSATLSAWVKAGAFSGGDTVLAFSGWKYALRLAGPGGQLLGFVNTDTTDGQTNSNEVVRIGEWTHVAMAYNDSGDRLPRLYLNGVECTYSVSTAATGTIVANSTFKIGLVDTSFFDGNIDDARLYSSALSASDIAILAAGGEPTTNPTAHWPLDDGPQYGEPSNGDPICVWESKDGGRINFMQTDHSKCPTYLQSGVNGRPGVTFDGVDDYLRSAVVALAGTSGTVVIAAKSNSVAATGTLLSSADEGSATTYYATIDNLITSGRLMVSQKNNDTVGQGYTTNGVGTSSIRILSVRSDGASYRFRLDGATETPLGDTSGDWFGDTQNRDNTVIGGLLTSAFGYPYNGVIYEVLAFDRCLSDVELRKVEKILAATYGITLAS